MILIADSGSTKCDWVYCKSNGDIIDKYKTEGINPNFISKKELLSLLTNSRLTSIKEKVKKLYFFGAGCSNNYNKKKLNTGLCSFFLDAEVLVKHDLEAAAYATYNNKPCITCILGTGSNTCFFDGTKLRQETPSLGFVLGDEASGNYFGKKILQSFYYKSLPEILKKEFTQYFNTNSNELLLNLYKSNKPNFYLASFFPFIIKNKKHKFINNIILKGINLFFENHIKKYDNYTSVPINFVGSVAFYLKDEIKEVGKKHHCNINSFIQSPIKNLVKFITNEANTTFL